MKKIPSFTVNHLTLRRGVYVSRQDRVGDEIVTTFDVRMKAPNREPALHVNAIHTMEHLAATWLRNSNWKEKIIYWGPMGCMTGNYLILAGDYKSEDIIELMTKMFEFIRDFEGDIPGASEVECGNVYCNNLLMAKFEAKKYLEEVLYNLKEENLNYPQ